MKCSETWSQVSRLQIREEICMIYKNKNISIKHGDAAWTWIGCWQACSWMLHCNRVFMAWWTNRFEQHCWNHHDKSTELNMFIEHVVRRWWNNKIEQRYVTVQQQWTWLLYQVGFCLFDHTRTNSVVTGLLSQQPCIDGFLWSDFFMIRQVSRLPRGVKNCKIMRFPS